MIFYFTAIPESELTYISWKFSVLIFCKLSHIFYSIKIRNWCLSLINIKDTLRPSTVWTSEILLCRISQRSVSCPSHLMWSLKCSWLSLFVVFSCWMAWEPSLGAFYGPVAFIVLVTCVYFLCTYVQLKRHPERKYELKEKTEDPQRMPSTDVGHGHITDPVSVPQATCPMISSSLLENEHSFKAQLRAAAFTLFLFTATWTFGALAVSQGHFLDMIFSCLYGAFCVTLGLFILIHHCAKRDDVWHCWWSCCPSKRNTYSVQVNVRPKVNVNGDTQVHAPCLQESPCPNKSAVFNHPAASHCKLTNLQAVQNHVNCLSPVTPCCAKMHCDQLLDDEAHIHVHNEGTFRPNMHIHRCLKSRTKPRYFSRHRSAGEREYAYHIPSSIDGSIHSSHTDSPHSTHESQSGHRRACCSKSDPYPTVN